MMELSVIQRECSAEFGVANLDLIFRYFYVEQISTRNDRTS
jgi:hypothetical protein